MRILLVGALGYCGRFLASRLASAHEIVGLDRRPGAALQGDYRDMTPGDLADFDAVLFFAGASSAQEAARDPWEALDNNCLGLVNLRRRMRPDGYLVWASSASIYSTASRDLPPHGYEDSLLSPLGGPYDQSKYAADYLLGRFSPNSLALRLGTVCGWGEALRQDTLFNRMNLDALEEGRVRVANRSIWRSILFLEDLAGIVESALSQRPGGPLNAFSMNTPIGALADAIAGFHGARVEALPDSLTYNFRMAPGGTRWPAGEEEGRLALALHAFRDGWAANRQ